MMWGLCCHNWFFIYMTKLSKVFHYLLPGRFKERYYTFHDYNEIYYKCIGDVLLLLKRRNYGSSIFFVHVLNPVGFSNFLKCKLWFHFIFGLTFFIPVWVYFPLFQIMIMSMRQIKTKIKLIWKKLNKVKIGFLAGQNRPWQILMNALCFTCDIITFDLKGHHL